MRRKVIGIIICACVVAACEYFYFTSSASPISKQANQPIRLESLTLNAPETVPAYFIDQKDVSGQDYKRGILLTCLNNNLDMVTSSLPLSSTKEKSPILLRINSTHCGYSAVFDPGKMQYLEFAADLKGDTGFTISANYNDNDLTDREDIKLGIVDCVLSNKPDTKIGPESEGKNTQAIAKKVSGKWSLHQFDDPQEIGQIEISNFEDNRFIAICTVWIDSSQKGSNDVYAMDGAIDPETNIIIFNRTKWINHPSEKDDWDRFVGTVNPSLNFIQAQEKFSMKKEEK